MENEPKQKRYRLTPEEYEKYKQLLEYLRKVRRRELPNFREGDPPNPNDRVKVESRLMELERLLENAEIITEEEPDSKG
jgi:transcription elongation GreA/GreB family factor